MSARRTGHEGRRSFLRGAVSSAGLALSVGCSKTRGAHASTQGQPREAEVTPCEDLMQEHGVLERILLLYDEAANRLEHDRRFDLAVLTTATGIVRRFVEEYHERLEEQFVFPRLQSARRETQLVTVLLEQHRRGRGLTNEIARASADGATTDLAPRLRKFVRMMRPHAAREDTVLFPAFRDLVGRDGYRELGEQFEEEEHRVFGERGFEQVVGDVARLERMLGIQDLAAFTPE